MGGSVAFKEDDKARRDRETQLSHGQKSRFRTFHESSWLVKVPGSVNFMVYEIIPEYNWVVT